MCHRENVCFLMVLNLLTDHEIQLHIERTGESIRYVISQKTRHYLYKLHCYTFSDGFNIFNRADVSIMPWFSHLSSAVLIQSGKISTLLLITFRNRGL